MQWSHGKGDAMKTYTKYFQCAMVLDPSNGSKWKPQSDVMKSGKKISPHALAKCDGTLVGIFTTKNGKKMQHFQLGSKTHICYNHSLTYGDPMETYVPILLIVPSPLWNIDDLSTLSMKDALLKAPPK